MKTKISLIGVFIAVLAILLLYSGIVLAVDIADSKHDLTSGSTASIKAEATATEICVFCHTPHGGRDAAGPLWNRTAATENISYDSYTTVSGTSWTPGGASKICLSCHDGTLGADSLVNEGFNGQPSFAAATETAMAGSSATIGAAAGDLVNDHPVGLSVPVQGDYALEADIITAGLSLYGASTDEIECATCHDAHDYGTAALGTLPFLAVSNLASGMCTTCHLK
jgi:hypothetical protein